jgi:ATP phosphoribosyltransferase
MKIGLPKGRLMQYSRAAASATPHEASTWFLRLQDIPALVADLSLDAGIASEEWIRESNVDVTRVAPLCWYHIRICAIGQRDHNPDAPVRIVSEYQQLASIYAARRYKGANIRKIYGASEVYIPVLADIAVDCVETGHSLRRLGLKVIEILFRGDVWVICSRETAELPSRYAQVVQWGATIRRGEPNCRWQDR